MFHGCIKKKSHFLYEKNEKILERIIKIQIHRTIQKMKIMKSKQKYVEFINRNQEKEKHFKSEIKMQKS